jgi:hypothetical protein
MHKVTGIQTIQGKWFSKETYTYLFAHYSFIYFVLQQYTELKLGNSVPVTGDKKVSKTRH